MKTEQQARNSRNASDEKLMAVLEHFLFPQQAENVFKAINDNQIEMADIVEMLEQMQFTLNDL